MTIRPSVDLALYAVHIAFWGAFGVTLVLQRSRHADPAATAAAPAAPAATAEKAAPFSRALVVFHMFAFFLMYFGIANAVLPGLVPEWFPGQRVVGTALIALGAVLMSWALVYFRSWRFRAKLDEGHQLATGGPFRHVRHPLYAGLDLLALGTAIWAPTPVLWVALGFMIVGSDLRGRAEEKLLLQVFGQTYADYCRRTRRFLPGVY